MKKLIIFIGIIASLVSAVSLVLCNVFLKTDKKKFPSKTPYEERKWLKNIAYKKHYIVSCDNKFLHGISVKNITNNWVIIVHGYDSEARNMACYAEKFYNMGYSVFMPDQRGFGLSEGNYTTMGYMEQYDIMKWIDYLNSNGAEKIVLFGVSMGAATVMLTAGNKLPSNVKAVIEDCGYTSVYDEFRYNLKRMFKLPEFPFLHVAKIITIIRNGWNMKKDASCIEAVKKSKIPILFIHGSADNFVPFYMQEELYENAECVKEKMVIYGAAHAESHVFDSTTYWNKIAEFIKRYME